MDGKYWSFWYCWVASDNQVSKRSKILKTNCEQLAFEAFVTFVTSVPFGRHGVKHMSRRKRSYSNSEMITLLCCDVPQCFPHKVIFVFYSHTRFERTMLKKQHSDWSSEWDYFTGLLRTNSHLYKDLYKDFDKPLSRPKDHPHEINGKKTILF